MLKAPPKKGTEHSGCKGSTYQTMYIVEHRKLLSGRTRSCRRIAPVSGYKLHSRGAETRQIRMSAGTTAAALQRRRRPCQLETEGLAKAIR